MKLMSLALGLSLLFSPFGHPQSWAQQRASGGEDTVIAVVGEKRITLADFNRRYEEVRRQTINPPNKRDFLEDLVRFEIGVQEAEKQRLRENPLVQERIRQEIYKALIEKEIGEQVQGIQVSEREMREWYRNNPELRTSHILISFSPDASQEQINSARSRAQNILQEVRRSQRPFEELVRLYSDDPITKEAGGDAGWQSRVTLVPNYYEAALKLKAGEISDLVQTQFGFHIIRLTGRRPYEEANKRQIRAAVFDEKRRQLFNGLFNRLKRQYTVRINENLLAD